MKNKEKKLIKEDITTAASPSYLPQLNQPFNQIANGNKKCKGQCGLEKPLSEFYIYKKKDDIIFTRGKCKYCHNIPVIKHTENILEGYKRCKGNKLICCNKIKPLKEFTKNKNCKLGVTSQCKECKIKYDSQWDIDNLGYQKQYRLTHKKERNKQQKQRKEKDINFKIICNLRNRLWSVLKGVLKSDKTINFLGCSIEFLKEHLKNKFYDNMTWKNYGKYWEIDHIVPCSLFDFTKETEQRKCFHYSNLQPLTCKDNLEKSNKMDWIKQ